VTSTLRAYEKVDDAAGMYRRYEIGVINGEPDLFGSVSVLIRFGRIGEKLVEKHVVFEEESQAEAFCEKKIREKVNRGYRPVSSSTTGTESLARSSCFFCRMLMDPLGDPCFVHQFPSSTLVVGWDQSYAGRSILVLNKHIPDFFRVSHQEMMTLLSDIKKSESAIRHAFHPDMMNYLFMGNVTQHAHLHLVPRYRTDPHFGSSPFLDTQRVKSPSLAPDEYRELAARLRTSMEA
jgi:diadenosine tetraphosphate (Ap4A) HIT family hydrolase/predicted DNA-binding WGR domain protein